MSSLIAPRKITLTLTITDQFLADVLTTAVEGGINYWCVADVVKRDSDLNVLKIVGPMDRDEFWEAEQEGDEAADAVTRWDNITLDTVALGIQRVMSGEVEIRDDLLAQVASSVTSNDADLDADAADCIVQAGLFGELVYG